MGAAEYEIFLIIIFPGSPDSFLAQVVDLFLDILPFSLGPGQGICLLKVALSLLIVQALIKLSQQYVIKMIAI